MDSQNWKMNLHTGTLMTRTNLEDAKTVCSLVVNAGIFQSEQR